MLAEANAAVPRLRAAEVRDTIGRGNALIVDVRDTPELAASGKLTGAVHPSRGTLEFRRSRDPVLQSGVCQREDGHSLLGLGRARLCGQDPVRRRATAGERERQPEGGIEMNPRSSRQPPGPNARRVAKFEKKGSIGLSD